MVHDKVVPQARVLHCVPLLQINCSEAEQTLQFIINLHRYQNNLVAIQRFIRNTDPTEYLQLLRITINAINTTHFHIGKNGLTPNQEQIICSAFL